MTLAGETTDDLLVRIGAGFTVADLVHKRVAVTWEAERALDGEWVFRYET